MSLPENRDQDQADLNATCPVCSHGGYLHDGGLCFGAPPDEPLGCTCRLPRRLVRCSIAVPPPPDAERWTLTSDAWYALEDAENARQDALDDDDGYDWNTPRYDVEGTRPWDLEA